MSGISPSFYVNGTGLPRGSWLIRFSTQNNDTKIDTFRKNIWQQPQFMLDFTDLGFLYRNRFPWRGYDNEIWMQLSPTNNSGDTKPNWKSNISLYTGMIYTKNKVSPFPLFHLRIISWIRDWTISPAFTDAVLRSGALMTWPRQFVVQTEC